MTKTKAVILLVSWALIAFLFLSAVERLFDDTRSEDSIAFVYERTALIKAVNAFNAQKGGFPRSFDEMRSLIKIDPYKDADLIQTKKFYWNTFPPDEELDKIQWDNGFMIYVSKPSPIAWSDRIEWDGIFIKKDRDNLIVAADNNVSNPFPGTFVVANPMVLNTKYFGAKSASDEKAVGNRK